LKALVFHGIEDIRLEDVDIPEIGDYDALLRVRAAAICGSDLRVKAFGHKCIPENSTRILGHEVSGEISKVGLKVKNLKPGDKISLAPVAGCGFCRECASGNATLCCNNTVLGHSINGGFAEYMKIPENYIFGGNIFVLPASVPFEVAAIVEPLATVFCGIEMCNVKPGDIVLIIGGGPIGIMNILVAKIFGAQKVIVSEVLKERREFAARFGADYVINPEEEDLKTAVMKNSYSRGADAVIIAAGSPEAQQQSLELAAIGGYINFFGTLPKEEEKIIINSNLIHYRNLKVLGMTGTNVLNFYRATELLISGRIDLSNLITGRFSLENFREAFESAKMTASLKVLFV
jgi:L-iditol 2-dehydrogenase